MPPRSKRQRAGQFNREARNVEPFENAAPTAAAGPSSLYAGVSFVDISYEKALACFRYIFPHPKTYIDTGVSLLRNADTADWRPRYSIGENG
jgi:hypothetical protein